MTRVTGVEMGKMFSDFINSSSAKERADFVKEVVTDHKTLQEDSFSTFLGAIVVWSEDFERGNYDGRNEYTCKASKVMLEALKEKGLF